MHVVHHAHLPHLQLGGELCICAADPSRGITGFEIWVRTLEAGAHTGPLRHGGEMVVLALIGSGKLLIDGGPQRFNGPCTLLIPAHTQFQLVNNSSVPLQSVWVFTVAPVAVTRTDGPPTLPAMAPSSDAPAAAGDETGGHRSTPAEPPP
jgi:hypothetical protein